MKYRADCMYAGQIMGPVVGLWRYRFEADECRDTYESCRWLTYLTAVCEYLLFSTSGLPSGVNCIDVVRGKHRWRSP